jgi:hypothetical protein
MVCRLRGIEGKQVGPGGTDRAFSTNQRRQEIPIRWNDRRWQELLRFIVRHQCHPGLRPGGKRPARCVKNRGKVYARAYRIESTFSNVHFNKQIKLKPFFGHCSSNSC